LSDTLIWLGYVIGGAIAFWLVYSQGWRITIATIVGGAVALAIWAVIFATTSSEDRSPWLQVELALNGSLSLIFAAAGAAVALALKHRRHE
jgi:threonine/homoserine/homoserine lactone efflux protein